MENLKLLVEKAISGDGNAFTELCKTKGQSIVYLCIKNMGNIQDGEDAAQEVFIRLQKELHSLKNAHAFDRWLYLMIQSTCNNLRKKNMKPTQNLSIDEYDNFFEEENLEYLPQALVESTEDRQNMLDMINEMPKNMRMCVFLFYYEGISYAEIAKVLDISVNSVKAFLYQARLRMKEKVENNLSEHKNNFSAMPIVLVKELFRNDAASIASESVVSQCIANSLAVGTAVAVSSSSIATTAVATTTAATGLAGVVTASVSLALVIACLAGTIVSAGNDVTSNSSLTPISESVPQHVEQVEQGMIEDIYSSEEIFVVAPSHPAEGNSPTGGESQNSEGNSSLPDSPVAGSYSLNGKIVLKDREGNALASENGNLADIRVVLLSDGMPIAQTYAKKDGSYAFNALNLKQKEYEVQCFYTSGNGIDFKEKESIASMVFPVGGESSINIDEMSIASASRPNAVLMFYDEKGNGQFTNPHSVKLYISDAARAKYTLQLYEKNASEPILVGNEDAINQFLQNSPQKGVYTLQATVTDVAKNQTTVELTFYIV